MFNAVPCKLRKPATVNLEKQKMKILKKFLGKHKSGDFNKRNKTSEKKILHPNEEVQGVLLHKRYREKITNKIVEIDAKGFVGSFLECHFSNCEIKIRCSAKYTFVMTQGCTFEDCLIWAHTKQTGGNWSTVFKNCSFKGRYELRFEKKLINCDFSQAKISLVALLENNDFGELNGIYFPNILILVTKENLKEWEQIVKPDDYEDLIWATAIKSDSVVIMNLNEHTTEPENLWNAIKHLSFIKTVRSNENKGSE